MVTNAPSFDAELSAGRNTYLRELGTDLEEIESLILDLTDPAVAAERKRKLARDVHSMKGEAGSYGLDLISLAVHRMEDDPAIQEFVDDEKEKYVDAC